VPFLALTVFATSLAVAADSKNGGGGAAQPNPIGSHPASAATSSGSDIAASATAAVVEFVRAHAGLVIRGNHNHAVGWDADPRCSQRFRRMAEETRDFTRSILDEESLDYLRTLPVQAHRNVDGLRFHACHATPDEPLYRYVAADSPFWKETLQALAADVLLTGHTHMPFSKQCEERRVLNPGSVGQPKHGTPRACYAVWSGGTIHLESAEYDVEATVAKINRLPLSPQVKNDLSQVLRWGRLQPAADFSPPSPPSAGA